MVVVSHYLQKKCFAYDIAFSAWTDSCLRLIEKPYSSMLSQGPPLNAMSLAIAALLGGGEIGNDGKNGITYGLGAEI